MFDLFAQNVRAFGKRGSKCHPNSQTTEEQCLIFYLNIINKRSTPIAKSATPVAPITVIMTGTSMI